MIGILKRYGFLKRSVFLNPSSASPKNALGLDEAPLTAGEKNRFLFEFPLLEKRVKEIKTLSSGRNLVTLVIGERGSGKTTLLNHFLQKSGLSWEYYRLQTPTDEHKNVTNESRPLFISKEGDDSRLVMDDAHQLNRDEMKQVLASAWSSSRRRKLGGIILFSEPRLRASLADLSIFMPAASVINRVYMPSLSRQRTEAYLAYRIRTAGCLNTLPFSANQLDAIHKAAKGLPGWVNGEAFMMYRRQQAAQRHARHTEDIGGAMDARGLPAT